jgi:hypothetical protein
MTTSHPLSIARAAPEPAIQGCAGEGLPAENASHPTQSSIARKSTPGLAKAVNTKNGEC